MQHRAHTHKRVGCLAQVVQKRRRGDGQDARAQIGEERGVGGFKAIAECRVAPKAEQEERALGEDGRVSFARHGTHVGNFSLGLAEAAALAAVFEAQELDKVVYNAIEMRGGRIETCCALAEWRSEEEALERAWIVHFPNSCHEPPLALTLSVCSQEYAHVASQPLEHDQASSLHGSLHGGAEL